MLAAGVVVCRYLFYSVYLRLPTEAPSIQLAFSLYIAGHLLILLCRHFLVDMAHKINKRGLV